MPSHQLTVTQNSRLPPNLTQIMTAVDCEFYSFNYQFRAPQYGNEKKEKTFRFNHLVDSSYPCHDNCSSLQYHTVSPKALKGLDKFFLTMCFDFVTWWDAKPTRG